MRDPGVWLCGVMCIYPILFFALPAYLIGRYRVKVRSPVVLYDDRSGVTSKRIQQPVARQVGDPTYASKSK